MSINGGYAVPPPPRYVDRFYNPPEIRRQQHQELLLQQQQQQLQMMQIHLLQQQQQQWRQMERMVENRKESDDDSLMYIADSRLEVTNLDRLMESVTPFVTAQFISEVNARGRRTREADSHPFFCLEDLWESFKEWSAYGAGVPLLLNGKDPIEQYYVPFLSGIQVYVDPSRPSFPVRGCNEETDAESCRLTSNSSSDADGKAKSVMNRNIQQLNKLSLNDKSVRNPSNSEYRTTNSPGQPLFQFLEDERPYNRRPLADKISVLKSQHPELTRCRSCDLLPSSWICVAWYPIYRIPIGPTLQDLDASFLTFHSLSTQSRSNTSPQFHPANTRKVHGIVDPKAKISLPVFALASYKLKGSIVSPCGPHECEQENSLLQAADKWLKHLQVTLSDYQFFRNPNCYQR